MKVQKREPIRTAVRKGEYVEVLFEEEFPGNVKVLYTEEEFKALYDVIEE